MEMLVTVCLVAQYLSIGCVITFLRIELSSGLWRPPPSPESPPRDCLGPVTDQHLTGLDP